MILEAAVMLMSAVKTGFMRLQQQQSSNYSIFECKKVFLCQKFEESLKMYLRKNWQINLSFSVRTRLLPSVPELMTN